MMTQDILYAVRLLRRRPVFFGVSIAGLALAIGVSTTAFSIVKAVAFAGHGIHAPESVVRVALQDGVFTPVTGDSPTRGNWAYVDYIRLDEATATLDVVASSVSGTTLRIERDGALPEAVRVMAVSDRYFSVLGFRAALGRPLSPMDARPGMSPVILSHGFWRNRLEADRSIVGRTVWLDDHPFTVVGVADRAHSLPGGLGTPPALWTTLAARREMWVSPSAWNPAVDVVGRLRAGVTRAQASAEMETIARALATGRRPNRGAPVVRLERVDERHASAMVVAASVMTMAGLVVLLACANITQVLLATAAARRREFGTRLAIGASRTRLARQLLTESVLIGALGGALGLMVAWAMTPSVARLVQIPPAFDVAPDLSAALFVASLAIAVGILAGLAPARYGWRDDLVSPLATNHASPAGAAGRGLLRSLLLGAQASVSVVLLAVAALLLRSVLQSAHVDPGYTVDGLVNVSIGYAPGAPARGPWQGPIWQEALQRVRGLPGVAAASLASIPPFGNGSASQVLNGRRIHRNETSPEYFGTLGIPVIRGRVYTADEARTAAPVAVISAAIARELWRGEDPIGATLERVWGPGDPAGAAPAGLMRRPAGTRVIGVVSDAMTGLTGANPRTIYLPLAQTACCARLIVRARGDAAAIMPPIREALQALDSTVRVSTALAADGWRRELEGPKILAALATFVGAMALTLAVIGLFGITAFAVEHRIHEMGVRRALGATGGQLRTLLLRETLRPIVIGAIGGVLLSVLAGHLIEGALYGISSRDPFAIATAVVVLLASSVAAILVPTGRASRIDPAQLLKLE
jgi:predicted permease